MLSLRLVFPVVALAAAVASGDGAEPPPRAAFHFDYDILPILQRQGCSSAYCHGSAKGRGGFKLSLFASDPEADFRAIATDLGGRRLDLRDPGNSLILKKPSRTVPHQGGLRLPKDSAEYAALEDWIRNGARYSDRLGVDIQELSLSREGNRVRARARFRQGSQELWRDVTRLSVFTCSDERVCSVDRDGNLSLLGPGEAWVFARYAGRNARLAVLRSYGADQGEGAATRATGDGKHPLDAVWLYRLSELGLRPSSPAPADTLARRLYLDLVDRPPTPLELQRFLDLPPGERVPKTADRLITRHRAEFGRKLARHLAEWMEVPDPEVETEPAPRLALYRQLRRELTREMEAGTTLQQLTAKVLSGSHALVTRFSDPRDRAEFVGRAFLGIRIGCARCHDHPLDRWRQQDNLAFSAYFANRRPDPDGGLVEGILFHPETDRPVEPRLLPTGHEAPAGLDHAQTVRWYVLDGAKEMFLRNMANRIFQSLVGRGLVEPLDDHRISNPASHESLLQVLADELAQGGLRKLVKLIVTSRLYQQDSKPVGDKQIAAARQHFLAQREARPLASATFRNAVSRVLGVAIAEPLPESPLARHLALLNGSFLHRALEQPNNVEAILDFTPSAPQQLREIFLLILSRPIRPEEAGHLGSLWTGDAATRKAQARDLAFALLASREFGSNR